MINAAHQEGLAGSLGNALATGKFIEWSTSAAESITETSTIEYGPGAQAPAAPLADELALIANASDTVAPNTVQLTAGTDFRAYHHLGDDVSASEPSTTSATAPVTVVTATATTNETPAVTNLTRMSADDVPCVR